MGIATANVLSLPASNYDYYIFILAGNANWKGGMLESINNNFEHLAKEIGLNSVIIKGLIPKELTEDIANTYFNGIENIQSLIPAIFFTNSDPKSVNQNSLKILIPLTKIEKKFDSIENFFNLLTDFTNKRNNNFIDFTKDNIDWVDGFNKVIDLKPNAFGIGVNFNGLLELAFGKKK
jgi:hypothetical protein